MSLRAKMLSIREEKQLCGPAVRQLILEKMITSVFHTHILHIFADCSIQLYLRSAIKSFLVVSGHFTRRAGLDHTLMKSIVPTERRTEAREPRTKLPGRREKP